MEKVKLKEICTLLNGRAYKQNELLDEGKYPVLRVGNFFSDKDFYYSDLELEDDKYCDTGDLLFAWSASFGPKIWDGGKVIYHYHIWKMVLTERVKRDYLYYYLFHLSERIKNEGHGGIMIHTTKAEMEEREFNLPSLEKQDEIVALLAKVKNTINLRTEELQQLDNLIKARFVELFGDPCSNPMGHTKMTIKEAVDAGYIEKPLDGNHGEKHPKASEYVDDGVPFVMANNLANGVVDYASCSKITRERADKLDKGFSHDGDVLITHKGTIGRTAIVHTKLDYIMLTPQVTYYRPLKGIIAEYLKGYFDTDFFQGEMKKLAAAGGSTRAYVGITNQTQLQLVIPSQDLQTKYAEFVKQVDKSKVA